MRFGMMRRSRSIAEMATSTTQKRAAIAPLNVNPKSSAQPATSSAVTSSTAGYFHGMVTPQLRQRPRSSRYERIGMLSRGEIGVSQAGHADGGRTIDRPAGRRDATTFK